MKFGDVYQLRDDDRLVSAMIVACRGGIYVGLLPIAVNPAAAATGWEVGHIEMFTREMIDMNFDPAPPSHVIADLEMAAKLGIDTELAEAFAAVRAVLR